VTFVFGYDKADFVVTVEDGAVITQPATEPIRTGYTFDGWYTPAESELYLFGAKITADLILHAKWTEELKPATTYIITFNFGEDGKADSTLTVTQDGILLNPPVPTPPPAYADCVFAGWYTPSGEPYDFTVPITSDLALTARWDENTAIDTINGAAFFDGAAYYDLQGRRVLHPVSGRLYLILYSSGTRQLLIKH
jgi:uncharacterized repeat protein (TIGR02543 family)